MYRWVGPRENMLNLIFLAGGIGAVVSLANNECVGKPDNYAFRQNCNECWCIDGTALCTNLGCTLLDYGDDDDDDDEDEGDIASKQAARQKKVYPSHTMGWNIGGKFPKNKEKPPTVTPYPPDARYRYHLRTVTEPRGNNSPKILMYPRPSENLRYPPYEYPHPPKFQFNVSPAYYPHPLLYNPYNRLFSSSIQNKR